MNTVQFLILAFMLGAPAVSWIIGKLRDQLEQKRARDEWLRRREEELRTGRASEEQPAGATAERNPDLEELAARRQEQIRRLKEQQARQTGAAAARPPKPTAQRPRPRPAGGSTASRPQPGVPYSTGQKGPRPARPGAGTPTRPRPQSQRPQPQRPAPAPQPVAPSPGDTPRRLLDPAHLAQSGQKMHALEHRRLQLAAERQKRLGLRAQAAPVHRSRRIGRLSRADLRRAVLMNEILQPPVSLRKD